MSLSLYKKKRRFEETSEPEGKEKSSENVLRFVIQKHDASHLHYDFRLEMEGVLKSWAVPKGPSLNTADKRLAMMVEDHPYDYKDFEGIIPAGNYGGGTVIVWDEGTYEVVSEEKLSSKQQEKLLLQQLHKGNLKLLLHGKKIKGEFALFQMKGRGERAWILMKKDDEFASEENILKKDKSVKSTKTLADVAKENGTELNHPEEANLNKELRTSSSTVAATKAGKKKLKTRIKKQGAIEINQDNASVKKKKTKNIIGFGKIQLDLKDAKDQLIKINRHELKLTNLNKLYWKKEKFSKGDMVNYYLKIAPFILPYMKDRPQSLNRHPNGIDGASFFQKDQQGKLPVWMQTHNDFSESTNKNVEYLVCNNEATLIYMANLGCIEMHPWHSRTASWEQPDWCLIDLDPSDKNSFEEVMQVAKLVKQVLDAIDADAYCKTSGSTGIHIYIPLNAKYNFEQSKQLAELVVRLINAELPEITSVERSPEKRKGKIYLDYLQNRQTQTVAAPYSLRPKPGMPVSTPIDWSELKKGLTPSTYNAKNIFERLKAEGDLFKPVLQKGINLQKVLKTLSAQLK